MDVKRKSMIMFHKASFEYRKRAFEEHLYNVKTRDYIVEAFIGISLLNDMENYIYYTGLLHDLNSRLDEGEQFENILNNLVKTSREYKRKVKDKELSLEWADSINDKDNEKKSKEIERLILKRFEANKDVPRDELIKVEKKQVEDSKNKYTYFHNRVARGKAIGGLNKGFLGDSLDGFKEKNKEEVGPFSVDDRLVKYMSDDLLRLRVVIFDIARKYNEKMKSYAKIADLDYLTDRYEEIGRASKEVYKNIKGIYPGDEIKSNIKMNNLKRHRLPQEDGVQVEISDLINNKSK